MKNTNTNINNFEINQLFEQSLNVFTLDRLANHFGIHKGTVKRWVQQNKVPKNYQLDFLRLLNVKYEDNFSIKEKDQYYTKENIALGCIKKFKKIITDLGIDDKDYVYIEPSAGNGSFLKFLPENSIGIDIDPKAKTIIKDDYLKWIPSKNLKYFVVGNPPFGLRGHLALQFINHSYKFADVVAFILPQLFNSDGKGSPKKRVFGYKLAYSEIIPPNSFIYPSGEEIKIHTIFQVWTKIKTENIKIPERKTCLQYIKIYSLSDGGLPSNTRNKNMLYKCDIYLPSTTYKDIKPYLSFEELPQRRGYGIVILKDKEKIKNLLLNHDWEKTAFYSSNSAINLRTSLIEDVLIKNGYYDFNHKLF